MGAPKEFLPVADRVPLTWQQILLTWKWAAEPVSPSLTLVIGTPPGIIIAREFLLFLQASMFR